MDMKINSTLVTQLRTQRAWTQQHLAQVSGLGLRTVQRVEKSDKASPETVKALCATFEIDIEMLLQDQPPTLKRHPIKSTSFRRIKRAISMSALMLSIVGSILLTSSHTAASRIEIKSQKVQISKDKNETGFKGGVKILIPKGTHYSLTPTNPDQEEEGQVTHEYELRSESLPGRLKLSKVEINKTSDGIEMLVEEVHWIEYLAVQSENSKVDTDGVTHQGCQTR